MIIWYKLLPKHKIFKWPILVAFFLFFFVVQGIQINTTYGSRALFFTDPGAINTVNTLRGEDNYSFLGKLLHNRSILVYKYLENVANEFNPAIIAQFTLIIFFVPFLIGAFEFIKEKYPAKELVVTYLIATALMLGFLRPELLISEYFLFLPTIILLVVIGMARIIKI
ncbi:MAG: hypothetical protein Q7R49_04650 [Candidatus Daviesbacteria bacterium]|nr:hypothetical protein [Candidatus Daviesbacteria bacterium]